MPSRSIGATADSALDQLTLAELNGRPLSSKVREHTLRMAGVYLLLCAH